MTEHIKSAIEHYRDVCVQMGQYPESDTYRYAELSIRSLNAWEEVLQELEKENTFWTRQAFKHKDDEFAEGRVFGLSKAIDIIKRELEGVTE